MKIVVLDGYTENPGDLSWDELKKLGDLVLYDRTPEDKIIERIKDANIVITNKTPISKTTLDICKHVKYIGVLATGYNVIDVVAAKEKLIPVCNIPTYGTNAVSQFAIALLLEICHNIGHHSQVVHSGKWATSPDWCFWDYPLIELTDKTMGIIGFGRIGQQTARIAKAMGMNVIAYDSYPNDSGKSIAMYVDLDNLYAQSDIIVLHCPLFPETKEMINKQSILKMKKDVIIINNSRGQLIAEQDLADALNSGKVYAAGLDVVSTEPIKNNNPLLKARNCFITPHIAWAPKESRQRLMNIAIENLKAFMSGKPINVVNR